MKIETLLTEEPLESWDPPVAPGCGADVRFAGVVRGEEGGTAIRGLHYEAYGPMAVRVIEQILGELASRHACETAGVRHRVGFVPVGEAAIRIQICARHRREAFAMLADFMDRLKEDVPIWKMPVP